MQNLNDLDCELLSRLSFNTRPMSGNEGTPSGRFLMENLQQQEQEMPRFRRGNARGRP